MKSAGVMQNKSVSWKINGLPNITVKNLLPLCPSIFDKDP